MTAPAAAKRADRGASDAELVVAIAGGDLTSLGLLFDRHHDAIRRLLSRLGVPDADLDDLVQQTFLEVPRASARFKTDAAARPWLCGLALMVARRRRRSVARMFARLRDWALEPVDAHVPTPAEECEHNANVARARRALESLPAKKRDAFVLVVLEGLSGADAAAILQVPVATIWTRVHYARNELRRLLDEEVP